MQDGSWGNVQGETDPYGILHPVWVATQCLRDRAFVPDANRIASKQWQVHIEKILQETRPFGSTRNKKADRLRKAAKRVVRAVKDEGNEHGEGDGPEVEAREANAPSEG